MRVRRAATYTFVVCVLAFVMSSLIFSRYAERIGTKRKKDHSTTTERETFDMTPLSDSEIDTLRTKCSSYLEASKCKGYANDYTNGRERLLSGELDGKKKDEFFDDTERARNFL